MEQQNKPRVYNLAFSRGNVNVDRRGEEGRTLLSMPHDDAAIALLSHKELLQALKMAAKHLAILYPNGLDEGLDGDAMCQEIARVIAKAEGR